MTATGLTEGRLGPCALGFLGGTDQGHQAEHGTGHSRRRSQTARDIGQGLGSVDIALSGHREAGRHQQRATDNGFTLAQGEQLFQLFHGTYSISVELMCASS
uniref:Uncharacterized protein n=1 Tax=Pseudomonas aeruginosa TaxID=287 RepID=B3G273_PSEAI|nr:hypothetical protein PACL_0347 [Pseudomonas aeruginosa]